MDKLLTTTSDASADVTISYRKDLFRGFRIYQEIGFELRIPGAAPAKVRRELLKVGKVAAVLPYDADLDTVVLFRQFRIGAHEATGEGDVIEIVAGLVDAGESLEEAARRETMEEIGVPVLDLVPIFDFLPTPGFCDEHGFLFCGRVSSASLPKLAGVEGEDELIRPFALPADQAITLALAQSRLRNGYTRLALLWFALNRDGLRARWSP
jgi:ADP-ribose pyrophosphatase